MFLSAREIASAAISQIRSKKARAQRPGNPMGNSASYVPPQKESLIYPKFEDDQGSLDGKTYAVTGCTMEPDWLLPSSLRRKALRVSSCSIGRRRARTSLGEQPATSAVATEGCVATSA